MKALIVSVFALGLLLAYAAYKVSRRLHVRSPANVNSGAPRHREDIVTEAA